MILIPKDIETDIALIGGGPSCLMAATFLLKAGLKVCLFERTSSLAKKLNVAGKSGLNISNSKSEKEFVEMYGKDADWMSPFIANFNGEDLREFIKVHLAVETYIGTSGKIFPSEDISGTRFIKQWIGLLKKQGLQVYTHHSFIGWENKNQIRILNKSGEEIAVHYKKAMFALGGVSWPMTGSDGNWTDSIIKEQIKLNPWQASNCGVKIKADQVFFDKWNGQFLKNVKLSFNEKWVKGEIRISKYGLEGKPIYHLVPPLRDAIFNQGKVTVFLDFKPNSKEQDLVEKLMANKGKSLSKILKKLAIHPSLGMLMKIYQLDYSSDKELVQLIKAFPIEVEGLADISKAISVVGGVDKNELNKYLMLKKLPDNYLAGEMVDWDAPTGGYLLQACFSMAKTVADSMIEDIKL